MLDIAALLGYKHIHIVGIYGYSMGIQLKEVPLYEDSIGSDEDGSEY